MNRKIRNTLIISTLFSISVPVMALKDDTQQPIVVNSEKQSLNLEKILPLSHKMLW
ncbi:lipopolysaccharide transport periplasmic protein LptA [Proteus mirabilis]|nr:lipopolysaccharide transport periplasmic protein LptA [Proteus mirabilis]